MQTVVGLEMQASKYVTLSYWDSAVYLLNFSACKRESFF